MELKEAKEKLQELMAPMGILATELHCYMNALLLVNKGNWMTDGDANDIDYLYEKYIEEK